MSTISISSNALSVRFTRGEKLAGLLRDVEVPLEHISGVTVSADGLRAARGVRAPGLGLPGRRKLGTWRGGGHGRTLVDVRRGQPAVEVRLRGHHCDRLLLGAPDAAPIAERIVSALPTAPTPV